MFETLAFGYGLAEAPRVDAEGNVYFSDVLGGGVHRWSPDGSVEIVVPKRRGIGGLLLHVDGGVVVSGRDVVHVRDGESRTLLTLDGVTGFNDMTADSQGRVYAGALRFNPFQGESPVPGELWRINAAGEPVELFGGIDWANGVGLSPDEATIYMCDYAKGEVLAHEGDETRLFARSPSGAADGLAVDSQAGVWVALGQGGGVARFEQDGSLEHVLDVPAGFVTSVCFGGEDLRDLYVTTMDNSEESSRRGTLFRTRVGVPGLPTPLASV